AVDVVIALYEKRLARRLLRDVVERTAIVAELGRQKGAERAQVGCKNPRRVSGRRRASGIRRVRGEWPRVLLVFEALEEEQFVPHDRSARPLAGVGRVEGSRIERLTGGLFADERLVPEPVIYGR